MKKHRGKSGNMARNIAAGAWECSSAENIAASAVLM